jgi:hypothetical protein
MNLNFETSNDQNNMYKVQNNYNPFIIDIRTNQQNEHFNSTHHLSKDFQTIQAVLRDMGILQFEEKVVNQMLEISYSNNFYFIK